jgi:hypothetical protein
VKTQSALTLAALFWFLPELATRAGEAQLLGNKTMHLRSGDVPEWAEFAARTPDGRRLELKFPSQTNPAEATLFVQQDDVRHDWWLEMNGKRLGKLFLMEANLVYAIPIPAGTLKDGDNTLLLIPPRENDDIILRDIRIDRRPMSDVLNEAAIRVEVVDAGTRNRLPCRLTIVDDNGALALMAGRGTNLAVRPGVVYTATGNAELGVPAGNYTIYASRGFEWSVATQEVHSAIGGSSTVQLRLHRTVSTPGWVSCDTHVHSFTHSGHGDATVDERIITLAGEGIELPVATEHNLNVDYSEAVNRAGLGGWITPVRGNEVTTPAGHFNIFPLDPGARAPDYTLTNWPGLMMSIRATPGVRVVVLNHPRNVHNGFQPFAATHFNPVTGDNLRGPEFSFDAMEVMNSSAQQSDYMQVYRDWFALLNHGCRITAVGSSDSHDVSRYIVGQGRTYIAGEDDTSGRISVSIACSNLLAGRALVSMGLLADLAIDGRYRVGDLATNLSDHVRVTVHVTAPPWSGATNVALYANGVKVREEMLANDHDRNVAWTVRRPAHDVHLVAIATGPGVVAPYWAIPRPYQPTSSHWTGRVIASTNPIWLDGDGDGKFSAARDYARRLVDRHGANLAELIAALNSYDEAVAAQAASLSAAAGHPLDSASLAGTSMAASPHVQRGIESFLATQH